MVGEADNVGRRRIGMTRVLALAVVVATLSASGCVPDTGGVPAPTPRSMDLWAVGDSISVGYAARYPGRIGSEGVVGASFVYSNGGNPGTIGQNTATLIGWFGVPGTIVLMGGVNDALFDVELDAVKAEIAQLSDSLSVGSRVVHVTEPAWTYRPYMTALNAWLLATYPDTIDCATQLDDPLLTVDGMHPTSAGYRVLAECVRDGLGLAP